MFRQLEQPADKKPVGKEVSQNLTFKSLSHKFLLANALDGIEYILGSDMVTESTQLNDRTDLKNNIKSPLKMLSQCLDEREC